MKRALISSLELDIGQRLEYEFSIRGFSKRKKEQYTFELKKFFDFIDKDPNLATVNDMKKFVIIESGVDSLPAIKFFYGELLGRKSFLGL